MDKFDEQLSKVLLNLYETLSKTTNYKEDLMHRKPAIGDIVHYQKYGTPGGEHKAEPSPAIVTKVVEDGEDTCMLFVMNPTGVYFNTTPYSPEPKPGHWSWP